MENENVQNGKIHMLIVDDEIAVSKLIVSIAQKIGYRCTVASDIAHFQGTLEPDISLIMLDLMMPTVDGIEFLRSLSEQGYKGHVVLMSGVNKRVLETAIELAQTLGLQVLGGFMKPFQTAELKTFFQQYIAGRVEIQHYQQDSQNISPQELRVAIAADQFVLHYQPQLAVTSGQIVGIEALVRWQHPEHGLLYPKAFVGLAESVGLINALGWLIIERGLSESRVFMTSASRFTLSLNVSAYLLDDLLFPDKLLALAYEYEVAPSHIILEITENGLLQKLVKALDVLTRLRMKEFQVSIDDFGTGYATMQQLRRIPATEVKIDRPFVHDALTDDRARIITRKTIELGHELGMRVVAEGVETSQHLTMLQRYACDVAQGHFFSPPLIMPDLLAWITQHGADPTLVFSETDASALGVV